MCDSNRAKDDPAWSPKSAGGFRRSAGESRGEGHRAVHLAQTTSVGEAGQNVGTDNQRDQPLTFVVRSSSWSQSVRLKIAKPRRPESAFLTTDVTDITDNQRGQPLTFVVRSSQSFQIVEAEYLENLKVS